MVAAAGCKAMHLPAPLTLWTWLVGAGWLLFGARALSRPFPLPTPSQTRRWLWLCGLLVVGVGAALRLGHDLPRIVGGRGHQDNQQWDG